MIEKLAGALHLKGAMHLLDKGRTSRCIARWACNAPLILFLAACGQGQATPTPLSPDVVRPVQPTPSYGSAAQFSLATPGAPDIQATLPAAPTTPATPAPVSVAVQPDSAALFDQPPSGLGIVMGGATLLEQPGGRSVASLPAGEIVTVTGKSADGRFVAVYTNAFMVGWVAAGQLTIYGVDELEAVETAPNPAPVATLMAEVMEPLQVLDTLVATPQE